MDAGRVNTDDELDIELEHPFVIYAMRNAQGKTIWVAETMLLEAASLKS